MALAIRFEGLLRDETIRDYAELARLGRVTRARMTQIMKLLDLINRGEISLRNVLHARCAQWSGKICTQVGPATRRAELST